MSVGWVIDEIAFARSYETGFPTMDEAARQAGHEVHLARWVRGSDRPADIPLGPGCVISYGSHQFVSQIKRHYGSIWTPCAYHRTDQLSYSIFSAHIGDVLLNDDFVLMPWSEIARRMPLWSGPRFVKPDAVTKAFTGQVVRDTQELSSIRQIDHPTDDLLCVVATPKAIDGEFRFVIVNGEVITGSEYRWDGVLDIRSDVHPLCLDMAKEVAKRPWQADDVYVCDVALTEIDGKSAARVIEMNCFSTSGLYACDTRRIVAAVSEAAKAEHGNA